MSLLQIAEVFGHTLQDHTAVSAKDRQQRRCPFRSSSCTKGNTKDPLGICSFTDGTHLATVCPVRFTEGNRLFLDAGRLAFGPGASMVVAPELRILQVPGTNTQSHAKPRRIGKIDYLIACLDKTGKPCEFAALEVQAVYFSGSSIRSAFRQCLSTGTAPPGSERRPDWRSSAQKRLMPQLALKVPVFRRWGKKFFVAVDKLFFNALPRMNRVSSLANSEITWLVYPFQRHGAHFPMGQPEIIFTTWDDVLTALREGTAPDPAEILAEIDRKRRDSNLPIITT